MATNYHDSGTHTLTHLAALNAITRQTGDGDIDNAEAVALLRRLEKGLRACAFYDVPVVSIEKDRIVADIALPEKDVDHAS